MDIPIGYCQCGCGEKTNIARRTDRKTGWIKGQPIRYIFGHSQRGRYLGRICKIKGCKNRHEAKGYCRKHYVRIARAGSQNLSLENLRDFISDPEIRFFRKIIRANNGCWIWTGTMRTDEEGWTYGQFYFKTSDGKNKTISAHRWSYEHFNGKIPSGKEVHHNCTNTLCVNPEHLEAITKKEHTARSNSIASRNGRKTQCLRGHLLSGVRVDVNGARVCRVCDAMRSRKYRRKKGGDVVCESFQPQIGT